MSVAGEDEIDAFNGYDHRLPAVTPEAVGDALLEFPLSSDRTLDWLAMAVRRSLAFTMRNASDGPQRASNSEIRRELEGMAETLGAAWAIVFDRSDAADSRLWNHAFRHWEGVNALAAADDPSFAYNRFRRALISAAWLADFMRDAARETEAQRGPWRRAEERAARIERGRCLAPVFESAFGQPVSSSNWPSDARHEKTPFMQFYQDMVRVAFSEQATPDLSGVLKEACRLHRESPVEFRENMIPGLSGEKPGPRVA